jgi:S1-C subfamily serine protease
MRFVMIIIGVLAWLPAIGNAEDFSELYAELSPTVVTIHTSNYNSHTQAIQNGIGSGVVIDQDKIITAAHVVHTARRIQVKFKDGYTSDAEILSSVTSSDVALLKLLDPPENIVIAETMDSSTVRIGEPVFVIGAPFGIEHTLSVGNLSGRMDRGLMAGGESVTFLQTDTAINQGNSGGPMFNREGKVIGIVSFILSKSGGFNGIGFAVSINGAQKSLMQASDFLAGFDGILLTPQIASAINVPQATGMLVQHVVTDSVAQKAGLRGGQIPVTLAGTQIKLGGDVVLAIHGTVCDEPHNFEQIKEQIASLPEGEGFIVSVLRGGEILELVVEGEGRSDI